MSQVVKLKQPKLHIAHESELLVLRRTLAQVQAELLEMRKHVDMNAVKTKDRKIVLSSNGQHQAISLDNILYCKAEGNYTRVIIRVKKEAKATVDYSYLLISKTLKSITDLIASEEFIRCHQSFLVNKKHVMGYSHKEGMQLRMTDDMRIPVSRRNKRVVLDLL